MSGSIAGNTYARNRFGNYARARTKPVDPNTARQQAVRSTMSHLTTAWAQTLTAVQRTAWNLYASSVSMKNRLGEDVNLTGYNHFLRSNTAILQGGGDQINAGPTIFELPEADPTLSVSISEDTQKLTVTFDDAAEWANEDGGHLLVSVGTPQNAQRNFFAGPYRYAGVLNGDSGEENPTSPDETIEVPFACSEGQRVWIKARIVRADGRLSEEFTSDCFCGA
jgi:hypothetical protein